MSLELVGVEVKGLLGYLDHEIRFPSGQEFICLHGPNGVGKTRLLELIEGALSGQLEAFQKTPFLHLDLTFTEGKSLRVTRIDDEGIYSGIQWELKEGSVSVPLKQAITDPGHISKACRWLFESGAIRRGISSGQPWRDAETGEPLSQREAVDRFAVQLPTQLRSIPIEVTEFISQISVELIEVNRLRGIEVWDSPEHRVGREVTRIPAPEKLALSLAELITNARAANSVQSQTTDRSFPLRLIQSQGLVQYPDDEALRERYQLLEEKRGELQAARLLQDEDPMPFPEGKLQDWQRFALQLHINDSLDKLDSFTDLARHISLFRNIVNTKLSHKRLVLDAAKGFYFVTDDGSTLTPSQLSSGEQHQVVLAYRFIFNSTEGELMLVDEPELSLHIAWQRQFLDDLLAVAQLCKVRFIVATHSPQIIGEWHDRMVPLGDVE